MQRGLFEDKVSNFWCVTSIFFKWRQAPLEKLLLSSTLLTLLSTLPASIMTFFSEEFNVFVYSMAISALSFFLFSFQVHEKSVLLAVVLVVLCEEEIANELFQLSSLFR